MIACLTVPYFAAAVERRDRQTLQRMPLVIGGHPWEERPVYAFSADVAKRGVTSKTSLRQAHLLSPEAHFLPAVQRKYRDAAGEVTDVLIDFTHLIEPEPLWLPRDISKRPRGRAEQPLPARYYLDLETLPLIEATKLVREIGRKVRAHTHLPPTIGLASDKFAAAVAAAVARPHHALPVEPEQTSRFMSGQPLDFLPLTAEIMRRLKLLGVKTIGELLLLSLPALIGQFGREIIPAYRLAQGGLQPQQRAESDQPRFERIRQFCDPPLGNGQTLSILLDTLAETIGHRLQARGQAARTIILELTLDSGQTQMHSETVRQPVHQTETLQGVLRHLHATFALTQPLTAVTVTAGDLVPAEAQQLSLFDRQATKSAVQEALDRLAKRYPDTLYRPQYVGPHVLPERRFALQTLGASA